MQRVPGSLRVLSLAVYASRVPTIGAYEHGTKAMTTRAFLLRFMNMQASESIFRTFPPSRGTRSIRIYYFGFCLLHVSRVNCTGLVVAYKSRKPPLFGASQTGRPDPSPRSAV